MKPEILNFLPEYTTIYESPDYSQTIQDYDENRPIEVMQLRVKTKDLVNAFMGIRKEAIKNAEHIKNYDRRMRVIQTIKRMVYF